MALYKDKKYLSQDDNEVFDAIFSAGQKPPHSGIYHCAGCGREVVAEENRALPPQNHHQHAPHQGSVRWKMVVYAEHKGK